MISDTGVRLECDCCGGAAAQGMPGMALIITDGQPLACGCLGHISCDAESEPYVMVDDCDCGGNGGRQCDHPGLTEKQFANGVLAECPECLFQHFIDAEEE